MVRRKKAKGVPRLCLHENQKLLSRVIDRLRATLSSNGSLSKPCSKFIYSLFITWLGLPVRYNFLNLSRFGNYSEKNIRLHFEQNEFDFAHFNQQLIQSSCGKHLIAAFDPSFISKSGKQTFGVDYFWDGCQQRTQKGLEVGCLAIVDVDARTAFPLSVRQTPLHEQSKEQGGLMKHYSCCITDHIKQLKSMSVNYLAVDGYFMKTDFIHTMLKSGLQVITRLRSDANLQYIFKGEQKSGRGRKKKYDGKVDCSNIDKRRLRLFAEDKDTESFSGIVYSVSLKREVRIIYIQQKKSKDYVIMMSTDCQQSPQQIEQYYRLRFQIEFLIRDAKSHAGFDHCQGRSQAKLNFHFNMSFSSVGLVKAATWMNLKNRNQHPFSMATAKTLFHNKLITDSIFSNLALDMSCRKIKRIYRQCINFGARAA